MIFWFIGLILDLLSSKYYNNYILQVHDFYNRVFYIILGRHSINDINRLIIPMAATFIGYVVGITKEDIGLL